MRICILVKDLRTNGGNRAAFDLAESLISHGQVVHIVCGDQNSTRITWHKTTAQVLTLSDSLRTIYEAAICTYYTELPSLRAINALTKIQYIQADYAARISWNHPRFKLMSEYLAYPECRRVFVSSYLLEQYRHSGISGCVIRPAIDHSLFFRDAKKATNKRRLLVEGSMDPFKRVTESYYSIPAKYEIWGLGPVDHHLPYSRMWVDPPQDQLRKIYSACAFLVKLSIKEGHPLSILEAMKCGCIPIVSYEGGHMDYCVDSVNCFVATESMSPTVLVDHAMNLTNRELSIMRRNCYETAISYQWHRAAQEFMDLIRERT